MSTRRSDCALVGLLAVSLALALAGCGENQDPKGQGQKGPAQAPIDPAIAARPAHPNTLAELMASVVAAQNADERARYVALMRSLVPTRAELVQMLRSGPATEAFLATAQMLTVEDGALGKAPDASLPLPKTERTEVFVHTATTEELAAYTKGSTAFKEFPGGMRRFAEQVAAPGRVWFAVELREPGKDLGTRLTCFTRVGNHFLMLRKPWNAMPPPAGENVPAGGIGTEPAATESR